MSNLIQGSKVSSREKSEVRRSLAKLSLLNTGGDKPRNEGYSTN